jgi:hypothetical protein
MCRGILQVITPQAEIRVHLQPHYAQLRKKRNKSKKSQCDVPQLALRAYPANALEDRGGTLPRFVERGYPTIPIITIPITLYGNGDGDDAEEGGLEGCAMGGSMGSTSATKSDAGVKLGVPTSSRTSLPARIVRRVATALQPCPTLRSTRPNSGTTRARLPFPPRTLPQP